jgi:hypothetical protein
VRFAEVDRSAMRELGATFVSDGYKNTFGRVTTQQFPAPDFSSSGASIGGTSMVFSDFLNLFLFDAKNQLGVVIKALQTKGLFQSLAEPNLVAESGKEASFLAGGEFPVPVAQGSGGSIAITVQYKEFGIRLNFLPVVNGNRVHLKVRPEVSTLDFANAVVLQGFRIPSLNTRRTETELELENGQTFAIAGLMSNTVTSTLKKIPGIGDIPILGYLFKSRSYQKQQTELVVMITPTIVRRGSTGVSSGLPNIVEPYLAAPAKPMPPPAPYVGSPRYPTNPTNPGQTTPGPGRGSDPQTPNTPAPSTSQPSAQPVQQSSPAQPMPQPAQSAPPAASPAAVNRPAPAASTPASAASAKYIPPPPAVKSASAPAVKSTAPTPTKAAAPAPDPKAAARDREDARKAAEAQKLADKKAAEDKAVADKKAAEDKAVADKKSAEEAAAEGRRRLEEKERQEKLDKDRAKHEAEVAKKNAEAERRKQEDQKKKDKAMNDAAERLKQAQAAYDRAKG